MKNLTSNTVQANSAKLIFFEPKYSRNVEKTDAEGSVSSAMAKEKNKNWVKFGLLSLREEVGKENSIDKLKELSLDDCLSQLKDFQKASYSYSKDSLANKVKITYLIQRIMSGSPYDCGVCDGLWRKGGSTYSGILNLQREARAKGIKDKKGRPIYRDGIIGSQTVDLVLGLFVKDSTAGKTKQKITNISTYKVKNHKDSTTYFTYKDVKTNMGYRFFANGMADVFDLSFSPIKRVAKRKSEDVLIDLKA